MSTAQNPTYDGPTPRTPARPAGELVSEALAAQTGATATELAEATGLGKSTVGKALAALQVAGLARRDVAATEAGGRRRPARWSPPGPVGRTTGRDRPEAADAASVEMPSGGGEAARLRPGQLGTLVLEYLLAHAGEAVGPTALGKALNRSTGAVANALARLAGSGDAVLVSEAPRRYRLAS